MPSRVSLTLKLVVAFVAVAAMMLGIALVIVERATVQNFNAYVDHTQMMQQVMAGAAAPGVANAQGFLHDLRWSLVLAGLGGVVLAGLAATVVARRITAPLRALQATSRAIAAGDASQRAAVHGRDEIAELAETFNEMAEALAAQDRTRKQFAADVAHELNTPLAVLQAEIEALQDGLTEPTATSLTSLHEETEMLRRIIDDLRMLSLADVGQLPLEATPCAVAPVVERAVRAVQTFADRAGVALRVDLSPGLPDARMDARRIEQVLINLVSNAVRHTPAQGSVTVQATAEESALRVAVIDTGAGIPAPDLPYVFNRFYRADPSRSRATGGSGLGLAIARQLVQAHGGAIAARNNAGRGATLTFTLPLAATGVPALSVRAP